MAAKSRAPKRAPGETSPKKSGGKPTKRANAKAAARRPDHKARFTDNPRVIRRWAEERGGKPATVKATRRQGDPAGLLRIDFPGYSGQGTLKEISWDDFFAKFDEGRLVFLYQDETADGQPSRFCKFISMESAEERSDK